MKQVANEACSNAKSCKVTMSSPPTLAKNVNEMKQHMGSQTIIDTSLYQTSKFTIIVCNECYTNSQGIHNILILNMIFFSLSRPN